MQRRNGSLNRRELISKFLGAMSILALPGKAAVYGSEASDITTMIEVHPETIVFSGQWVQITEPTFVYRYMTARQGVIDDFKTWKAGIDGSQITYGTGILGDGERRYIEIQNNEAVEALKALVGTYQTAFLPTVTSLLYTNMRSGTYPNTIGIMEQSWNKEIDVDGTLKYLSPNSLVSEIRISSDEFTGWIQNQKVMTARSEPVQEAMRALLPEELAQTDRWGSDDQITVFMPGGSTLPGFVHLPDRHPQVATRPIYLLFGEEGVEAEIEEIRRQAAATGMALELIDMRGVREALNSTVGFSSRADTILLSVRNDWDNLFLETGVRGA